MMVVSGGGCEMKRLSVVVVSGGGCETKRKRNTTLKVVRRRGKEGNLRLPFVLP